MDPVRSVEAVFNDTIRTPEEKAAAYENLFFDDVVFDCSPPFGTPDSLCGYPFQPDQAREVFEQVASGSYSVSVALLADGPLDLTAPPPGREGWMLIFLTNVHVRIINPEGGYEFNGGQGEVLVAREEDGLLWKIAEWTGLPRPSPEPP